MCFRFRAFPFPSAFFRPLLFRFRLLSLCFFLSSFFPFSPSQWVFFGAPFRSRFLGLPRSFRPDLSCPLSRFLVLGFLFVSFRPSLIRSHSCSSGAYLVLSLSVFFPFLPLSFVRFCSGSGYSAFCFFLSSFFPFPPLSCFFGAASLPFGFLAFPRSFRPGFPCLLSWFFVLGFLFVSFHPSRFRSHSCSTGASLLLSPSGFPLSSAFFRPLPFRF